MNIIRFYESELTKKLIDKGIAESICSFDYTPRTRWQMIIGKIHSWKWTIKDFIRYILDYGKYD